MVQHDRFKFVNCNLKNEHFIRIQASADGSTEARVSKTDMDKYRIRDSHMEENLHQYLKRTKKTKNKEVIMNYFPKYWRDSKNKNFAEFCRMELVKYRPWHGDVTHAWRTNTDSESEQDLDAEDDMKDDQKDDDVAGEYDMETRDLDVIMVYTDFMKGDWAIQNLSESVRNAAKFSEIQLEEDERDDPEPPQQQREAWQYICERLEQCDEVDVYADHDWQTDRRKYLQYIPEMQDQMQKLREMGELPLNLHEPAIDTFTDGQWCAYEVVRRHFEEDSKEQLLMAVFGTAGTGKSYLIDGVHYMLQLGAPKSCRILATTGLAAHNIKGKTMHSDLCLPVGSRGKQDLSGNRLRKLQERLNPNVVKYIVIDEISMCSQTDFYWIDQRLRQASGKKMQLFGGYNLIIVGDFGQLPPVGGSPLWRRVGRQKEQTGHFLYKQFRSIIKLEKVKRQSSKNYCGT